MLVIIAMAVFWYGLVPVAGAFASRRTWRLFRQRFNNLRLKPLLDYGAYRHIAEEGGIFRFTGGFESVTDGHTLWIRNKELTIPVALNGAHTYMLPMPGSMDFSASFDPGQEAPRRIRWSQVSSLTEGAKVFVGGSLQSIDGRWAFAAAREHPLLVIFYEGPDQSLAFRTIRAGRHRNEYWNPVTPYAIALGAFFQLFMAVSFLPRPAFQLTALTAFIAVFTPLFPLIPPGILLTTLYRRLWWQARIFRAYRDLARLPLRHLEPGREEGRLPSGERYGYRRCTTLPENIRESIPRIIPLEKDGDWYIFGVLDDTGEGFPREPRDSLASGYAVYGALPGNPEKLARGYNRTAYLLEFLSWIILLAGIGLNIFFIGIIITILG